MKVSYLSLLKEAIQEYDAKAMDKLGPMTEPILTYRGDGELKTHYEPESLTSSVLERYYFDENKEKLVEMDEDPDGKSEASDKSGSGPEGDAVDPNEIVTGEEADAVPSTMDDLEDEILDEDFELDLSEDPDVDDLIANEKPLDEKPGQDICAADEEPLDDAEVMQSEDFELDENGEINEGIAGTLAGGVLGGAAGKHLSKKGAKELGALGGSVVGASLGHLAQQRTKQAVYRPESISLEDTVISKLIQEMEAEDPDGKSEASDNAGSGPEGDAVDPNEIVTGEEADSTQETMGDLEDEILDEDFALEEDDIEDEPSDKEKEDEEDKAEETNEDFDLDEDFALEEDDIEDEPSDKEKEDEEDKEPLDVDKEITKESFEGRGPITVSKARELGEAFKIFQDEIDE